LFGSGRDIAEVVEQVMRLSAWLVRQRVLEDEVLRTDVNWCSSGLDWPNQGEHNPDELHAAVHNPVGKLKESCVSIVFGMTPEKGV
jgi:hypothetical protein